MATKVVMPKLSDTMTEGTINEWLKKEGDRVEAGEALATVETDKATMELEAYASGVLRRIVAPAGSSAPVGNLIAVIAEPDEDIGRVLSEAGPGAQPAAARPGAPQAEPRLPGPTDRRPSPAAATAPGPKPDPRSGGLTVPVTERHTSPQAAGPAPSTATGAGSYAGDGGANGAATAGGRVKASPLARRIAELRGIDLSRVAGSGPDGRVVKRDVEAYETRPQVAAAAAPAREAAAPGAPPATPRLGLVTLPRASLAAATGPTPYEDRPVSSMRRVIAQRMVESKTTVPHYYLTAEVDMDRAVEMRAALVEAAPDVKVTYTDMIVKACGLVLARHPQVNASFLGDRVRYWQRADIGLAVALEEGLITPIITGCDLKSLGQIALEAKALAERARARQLKPEEYQGGSFSVSNLGMFDVEVFSAVINPPQGAILAVGALSKQPVVKGDGALAVGHRMRITLSCDHRVIDGAVGAAFLRDVKRLLEVPAALAL